MVKAQEFWNFLCEECDYRIFSGVACKGLLSLYKTMSSEFMHYIPAANEKIALGIVSGACMGGFKGGILMDMRFKNEIATLLKFNVDYKIPFLIIGYGTKDDKLIYDFPSTYISDDDYKTKIKKIIKKSETELVPGLIVIGEGVL